MNELIRDAIKCPKCDSDLNLNNQKNLYCQNCLKEYVNNNSIIDLRNIEQDKTRGFSIDKDILISQKLMEVFNKINHFNGLFYIYEQLATKKYKELINFNTKKLIPKTSEQDTALHSSQSIHGFDVLKKIDLYREDFNYENYNTNLCLENGCGLGLFIEGFSKKFKHIIVVDFSISFLVLAKKICEEKKLNNVTLICANAEKLPIKDNKIDFIHSNNVIEHVTNQNRMVSEIYRSLKVNGFLFLMSPNKNSAYFEPHFRIPFYGLFPFFIRKWLVYKLFKRDCREVSLLSLNELKKIFKLNFIGKYNISFLPSKLKITAQKSLVRLIIVNLLNNKVFGKIVSVLLNKLLIFFMPYHVIIAKKLIK